MYFTNYDLENVVTPVDVKKFQTLLTETNYNPKEIKFIVDGFTNGFDLGYRGKRINIQRKAPNLVL